VDGRLRGISWNVVGIRRIVIGIEEAAVYLKHRKLPTQSAELG
jgi:hypothetical protein